MGAGRLLRLIRRLDVLSATIMKSPGPGAGMPTKEEQAQRRRVATNGGGEQLVMNEENWRTQ